MNQQRQDRQLVRDARKDVQFIQSFPLIGEYPAKVYLYKKAERISVALHLITNHIKDGEPSKWEVRNSAIEIVRSVSKLTRSGPTDRNDIIATLVECVLRVMSSLESLSSVGSVSPSNASLIRRELSFLLQLADGHVGLTQDSGSIDESVFDVPAVTNASEGAPRSEQRMADAGEAESKIIHKKDISDTSSAPRPTRPIGPTASDTVKDDRRSAIVNLLKTKVDLSVKDFTDVIPGVSEKTIQRELVSMYTEGLLRRSGARRWTRYALA
jgi:hypothetical protein